MDWERVHGEGLPAYEHAGGAAANPNTGAAFTGNGNDLGSKEPPIPGAIGGAGDGTASECESDARNMLSRPTLGPGGVAPSRGSAPPPDEPPPGYEEAQQASVADRLEARVRRDAERGEGGEESCEGMKN